MAFKFGLGLMERRDANDNGCRYVFDLHAAIPYHSMPEAEREEIWDDGLHFTPKGYDRMGELVAVRLMEIIEAEEAAATGEEVPKEGS